MLPAFPVPWVSAWSRLLLVSWMSWGVSRMISPAFPSALVVLRMLVLLRVMLPWLVILTLPAGLSPLVSLSMVTSLRLRLPELMMDTSPDWPCVAPRSICLSPSRGSSIVTCLLVMMDKSLSSRFPCA